MRSGRIFFKTASFEQSERQIVKSDRVPQALLIVSQLSRSG
jgi:hypothetical protein